MKVAASAVSTALGLAAEAVHAVRDGELVIDTRLSELPGLADRIVKELHGRLMSLFGSDDRQSSSNFTVHHVWSIPALQTFLRVSAPIDPAAPVFPSIAAAHPAANWFEREVMDVFGLTPEGHPNPARVALHDDWPDGAWALRKDFPMDRVVPRVAGDFHPFRPVTGEGVFQVPVGPVHAGVIEPGHFRFGVAGEPVLYLQLRLFYVHKGIEKRFERLPWQHGVYLAESISGDTAVGHALAHVHAIERLTGIRVPPRASALRVVLLELERLYNHTADIGALATDVAFTVPASRAQAMREGLVRLQDEWLGTRLLRNTVTYGGVRRDLVPAGVAAIRKHLRAFGAEFARLVTLLIDAGTFTDRVDATGILTPEAARDLGIVGMAARASGLDADLRRDHPHDAYAGMRFVVPVEDGGDVRARLMVRAREVEQSLGIVRDVLDALPDGPIVAAMPASLPERASALGWAEGWRGPCLHFIATDPRGQITRVKVTDPSFLNWPGLAHAVPGNIIPDFPVINKSFNLSTRGTTDEGLMFQIIATSLKTGVLTEADPFGRAASFGFPVLDASKCTTCADCARACPTGAIAVEPKAPNMRTVSIAWGACIQCRACVTACPAGAISVSDAIEVAGYTREQLTQTALFDADTVTGRVALREADVRPDVTLEASAARLRERIQGRFGRSLHVRQVDAGSCNGCELEIGAITNPRYDLERFGIHFVASPRHADVLLVTGPVTRNMEIALRRTYDAAPDPRVVVAVGACGCSGGIFGERTYASVGGVDRVVPVDVYIPGCPPRPQAILNGLLVAMGVREARIRAGAPA